MTGISAVLTLLILVLSEIIPKTLGAVYCKPLAAPATTVIQVLVVVGYPFVKLSEAISRIITGRTGPESVSRDEVASMAEIGVTEGTLLDRKSRVIRNLLHMANVRISEIMTHRSISPAIRPVRSSWLANMANPLAVSTGLWLFTRKAKDSRGFLGECLNERIFSSQCGAL